MGVFAELERSMIQERVRAGARMERGQAAWPPSDSPGASGANPGGSAGARTTGPCARSPLSSG
ncbi:MAG TPA: hypothetical protein VIY51_20670 [Xanthobacteraceae bacterium]